MAAKHSLKKDTFARSMFEAIEAYFQRGFQLSEQDKELIHSVFTPRTIKKDEFLVREGEINKNGAFVAKGFLRSYMIDNKGKQHIIQFAPENWWISDKDALAGGKTSSLFIDAIEDSELLLLDFAGHKTLLEKLPGYAASFQQGMHKRMAAKDQRIIDTLTASAEERYQDFLKTYPTIAQRVPQHMLASYLGITPETVSRIRKKASVKK
jgi:CRP-like cAMP-binding protein